MNTLIVLFAVIGAYAFLRWWDKFFYEEKYSEMVYNKIVYWLINMAMKNGDLRRYIKAYSSLNNKYHFDSEEQFHQEVTDIVIGVIKSEAINDELKL